LSHGDDTKIRLGLVAFPQRRPRRAWECTPPRMGDPEFPGHPPAVHVRPSPGHEESQATGLGKAPGLPMDYGA